MVLMLLVVACYTVCGLSDKYSVAKLKFDGNSFTFLLAKNDVFKVIVFVEI